jgi:hypothetical protein
LQEYAYPPTKSLMHDKVERPDIGKRTPDNVPFNDFGEKLFDTFCCHVLFQ